MLYDLGHLLLGCGDSQSASRRFAIAAARQPDNPYLYDDWAWSLEISGDPADAAALYRMRAGAWPRSPACAEAAREARRRLKPRIRHIAGQI